MTATTAESRWDTWLIERLPEEVGYEWSEDKLVLALEGEQGPVMVTIDWQARRLAPGAVTSPHLGRRSWEPADMAGRGWRDRLLAAAVEELWRMRAEDRGEASA